MNLPNVVEFRQFYKKFLKSTEYMIKKRLELDPKSDTWARIKRNYQSVVIEPMEEIWAKLTESEKMGFIGVRGTR